MSRQGDIREALATVLRQCPSLKEVSPYPPDAISLDQVAWIGFLTDEITAAQQELHLYTAIVTVCVMLDAQWEAGIKATEPIVDEVLNVIRVNQGLGLASVYRVEPQLISEGGFGNPASFIGFELTLQIKQKLNVSYRRQP